MWPGGGRLGLAVSGGPDSLALLLLAQSTLSNRIEAATVDHGLRRENADEAAMVAGVCARQDIPHATLAVSVASGNVQSEARSARYAALADWMEERGLDALATAHHADDQAETVLLRLNRASGVAGLAGVRPRGMVPGRPGLLLLRPLLGFRRAELAQLVASAGIEAAQDPSNADDRFDRARLRKVLAEADWLNVGAIAESASHLADADTALDWASARAWQELVERDGLGLAFRARVPRAIALRVLARIVREMDGEEPRGGAIARLHDSLAAGQLASIGDLVARPSRDVWTFHRSPRRRR